MDKGESLLGTRASSARYSRHRVEIASRMTTPLATRTGISYTATAWRGWQNCAGTCTIILPVQCRPIYRIICELSFLLCVAFESPRRCSKRVRSVGDNAGKEDVIREHDAGVLQRANRAVMFASLPWQEILAARAPTLLRTRDEFWINKVSQRKKNAELISANRPFIFVPLLQAHSSCYRRVQAGDGHVQRRCRKCALLRRGRFGYRGRR